MFDDLRNFIDISAEEYHADKEILGHSALVEILKSPKHYYHRISNPHVPTASLEFGTALHAALLEPQRFAETYIVSPKFDRRTKEGKADAAAWEEANKGSVSVDEAELKKLQGMQKAVFEHSGAKKLLSKCYVEMSYFWTDEDTGFQCRVRPDVLALDDQGDVIAAIDVKSTSNASKEKFRKSVMDYGYDLNAAFYSDAIERAIGRRVPYYFLAVESAEPYGVALYKAGQSMLDVGRDKYRSALQLLQWCRENDRWPSYQPFGEYEDLEIPEWYARRLLTQDE